MEKMRMESIDISEKNIEKIAKLFPNVITEGRDENGKLKKAVNFELLKQILSEDVVDGDEAYEFTWVGKKSCIVEAGKPIRKTLRPCKEESKDWETTENLYIEGDNLDVLKLLQESYLGAIKFIYIDPPYNTGNDFIYCDNFIQSVSEYEIDIGAFDEEENRLIANTENNGRFHSDWCSMMYSRLLLAKNLLSEDGAIFISIDDNEVENMKKMCDEIFGATNFITQIVWEKVHTRKNSAIYFSSSHEYILCYAKRRRRSSTEKDGFIRNLLPREDNSAYTNPDNDPKGPWKADPITAHNYYSANYKIIKPDGTVIEKPEDRYWAFSEESWKRLVEQNSVIWGNGSSMPMVKRYLCDVQDGLVPTTIFSRDFAGDTSIAKKRIDDLLGAKGVFEYTKPTKLLYKLLTIATNPGDIVLDFFSGSATLADALFELNVKDNGNRKFILVQIPEKCEEETAAKKAGYNTICDIGKARIEKAGLYYKEANSGSEIDLDTGFRVLKLDSSNMKDVYYAADEYSQGMLAGLESNIKEDRTDLDLLFGCLLEWGLPLSLPHTSEVIDGATIHTINDGDLIACFSESISEAVVKEIAARRPLRVVFRDSSFADSPQKINVGEIFKLMAPNTSVKVL